MFYKLLVVLALVLVTFVILVILWRKAYELGKPRHLTGARLEDIQRQLQGHGFVHFFKRQCLQSSMLHTSYTSEDTSISLEFCDGLYDDYTRATYSFPEPLGQGISILCEDRLGVTGALLKFREITVGNETIDDAFILMAQDRARMMLIFKYRPLRRALMALKEISTDMVVSDTELFAYRDDLPEEDILNEFLARIATLSQQLRVFSSHYGPINSTEKRSYTELLDNMNLREELDLDAEQLEDFSPSSSPKGMDDVTEMLKAGIVEDEALGDDVSDVEDVNDELMDSSDEIEEDLETPIAETQGDDKRE